MNMTQLKEKYARLSGEIDALTSAREISAARLTRLQCALDRIELDLATIRALAQRAPVLRDVVGEQPRTEAQSPPYWGDRTR
jgi:hypothetical protein